MAVPGWVDLPYRAGSALHRALYRSGLLRRASLDAFTVSVGSLHFGGAGKSPVATHLTGPGSALLLRGYRGRQGATPRVLVGESPDGAPWLRSVASGGARRPAIDWSADVGDEAALAAALLPGVPIGAGADRVASADAVRASHDVRRFVLDDGFPHHRLERDLDVLVLPVLADEGDVRVAPGPLREGARAAVRAGALVLVGDGPQPLTDGQIDGIARDLGWTGRLAACRKVPGTLWNLADGGEVPRDALQGVDVAVVCALGRPGSLTRAADGHLRARVGRRITRRDHHRFDPVELTTAEGLARLDGADVVLTSLKDAVRMPGAFEPSLCWIALGTTLVWDRGEDILMAAAEDG